MARIERIRESVAGPVDADHLRQKSEAGWRLVALEWRREIEGEEQSETMIEEVPYGLRVAFDCLHLEEDPQERMVLITMMDLIVQDHPISQVAAELNRRGFQTREGLQWNPVAVFNMLPRLIEVGPRIFSSEEWEARRERLMRVI